MIARILGAILILQQSYHQGFYGFQLDWHDANVMETLVNVMDTVDTDNYMYVVEDMYKSHNTQEMKNWMYNDDLLWFSHSWLRAYQLTGNMSYLERSRDFFDYVAGAWDNTTCHGGVYWNDYKTYKNAITNELFIQNAKALYDETKLERYKDWYLLSFQWFFDHFGDQLVYDGLTSDCKVNNETVWSYNQGVILSGMSDQDALSRVEKTIATLTGRGVLQDYCETPLLRKQCDPPCPRCDHDQEHFKGIFMRQLFYLSRRVPLTKPIRIFVNDTVQSLVTRAQENNSYGLCWSGHCPFYTNYILQSSAIDALLTAYNINE